ncbi:MAG TPA: aldose epimerase family protein [Verrucomicrobiae bacterium]|nr:aldose epimerase family protein [Verrucomicrobiae bacterium]
MFQFNVPCALGLILSLAPLQMLAAEPLRRVEVKDFGKAADGQVVKLFTLRNSKGMSASVMSYGAVITEIQAADRNGRFTNVVLGAGTFEEYMNGFPGSAAVIGRVANRIAKARFKLDGQEFKLAANNGKNHIHGGNKGFASVLWMGKALSPREHEAAVEFTYLSKDGEEGYPGNLQVKVTYTLTDENEFRIDYAAETDRPTPVNLTNHAYFNLAGAGDVRDVHDVLDHVLWIAGEQYTPAHDDLIPTGEFAPVRGTPLDFTKPTRVGERIDQLKPKLNGYDHNFVIKGGGKSLVLAARVSEPGSGRTMEVETTQPGVQLYTGNHLNHRGLCLETQHYPDSINQPNFPSVVLRPGAPFKSSTVFRFLTQ